jgi:enoyl-CoA hydratase/carnithine racemase
MSEARIEVDTGTGELLCEIRDRVAVITLNRPEARNALSDRLTPALRRMIKQCGDDPNVGALLITGTGTAFCAGGDVEGMGNNSNKTEMTFEERVADLRTRQRTLTGALVAVRKPTIAALPGPAAGAGMALALVCDIRIAAESAIMSTGYARIGLTGDYGIAWLLTRLVGTSRARELMFLSERIDARRCRLDSAEIIPEGGVLGLIALPSIIRSPLGEYYPRHGSPALLIRPRDISLILERAWAAASSDYGPRTLH